MIGNGDKLTALRIKDRKTEEERLVELDGVFVQIGLSANSAVFRDVVETNRPGEVVIDAHCRTNVTGIYAAGDVSTVPYKQIIISMGEGAKSLPFLPLMTGYAVSFDKIDYLYIPLLYK